MDLSLSPALGIVVALLQLGLVRYGLLGLRDRPSLHLACGVSLLATCLGAFVWFASAGFNGFALAYLGTVAAGLSLIWTTRARALA